MPRVNHRAHDLRRRIYEILERGSPGDRISVVVDRGIVALIVINLVAVALESVPELAARHALVFDLIEWISLVVFTAEYGLRIWVAVEHAPFQHLKPAAGEIAHAAGASSTFWR